MIGQGYTEFPPDMEPTLDLNCSTTKEENIEHILAWVEWAKRTINKQANIIHDQKLHKLRLDLIVEEAKLKANKCEQAVKGMEDAIRLRKGVEVFETGTKVLIGSQVNNCTEIEGTIYSATIQLGFVTYAVWVWHRQQMTLMNVPADQVRDADGPLSHPRGG